LVSFQNPIAAPSTLNFKLGASPLSLDPSRIHPVSRLCSKQLRSGVLQLDIGNELFGAGAANQSTVACVTAIGQDEYWVRPSISPSSTVTDVRSFAANSVTQPIIGLAILHRVGISAVVSHPGQSEY
jgi:hypothetical protein